MKTMPIIRLTKSLNDANFVCLNRQNGAFLW